MVAISAQGMKAVQEERAKKQAVLHAMLREPFDLNNALQVEALKQYLVDFDRTTHLMYLYQAMGEGLKAWGATYVIGCILPIPEFAKYLFTACLYIGIGGYLLKNFSMTDYYEQLEDMKMIYNWCLKQSEPVYVPGLDNTDKLANPLVQRLVRSMAPLCDVEFMLAWERQVPVKEAETGGISKVLSSGYNVVSSVFSLFAANKTPTAEINRVNELKRAVETRELDLGVVGGFKQALEYFSSNTEFRDLMKTKINEPLEKVKNMIPVLGHVKMA